MGACRRGRDRDRAASAPRTRCRAHPSRRAGGSICRSRHRAGGCRNRCRRAVRSVDRDAMPAPRHVFRNTGPTCPRNGAAFRRGRRCARRIVPPCRCRGEASRAAPVALLVLSAPEAMMAQAPKRRQRGGFTRSDNLREHRSSSGRACPGHPRLKAVQRSKTWMPGTRPGMTKERPALALSYPACRRRRSNSPSSCRASP